MCGFDTEVMLGWKRFTNIINRLNCNYLFWVVKLFKIQLITSIHALIQFDGSAHGACWDGGINPALSRPTRAYHSFSHRKTNKVTLRAHLSVLEKIVTPQRLTVFTTGSDRVLGEENGCLGKCSVKITLSTSGGMCEPLQEFEIVSDGKSAPRMLSTN